MTILTPWLVDLTTPGYFIRRKISDGTKIGIVIAIRQFAYIDADVPGIIHKTLISACQATDKRLINKLGYILQ